MKAIRMFFLCVAAALLATAAVRAQEKPKPTREPRTFVPLKIQVVFSEFDGEKKVSSLPYTVPVNAREEERPIDQSRLRMGIRVPIVLRAKESQVQYMDVGTDIDCWAQPMDDGRFRLNLSLRRSSVYSPGPEKKPIEWAPGEQPLADQPIVRQFSGSFDLLLRDGQTMQTTMATDPVSGRVVKVDVTLNVVK